MLQADGVEVEADQPAAAGVVPDRLGEDDGMAAAAEGAVDHGLARLRREQPRDLRREDRAVSVFIHLDREVEPSR